MWSILTANALIMVPFSVFLLMLWHKPQRPKPAISDEELHRLANQLRGAGRGSAVRPQDRVLAHGQLAEAPADASPLDPRLAQANRHGRFSLTRPYQRVTFAVLPVLFTFMFGLWVGWVALFIFLGAQRIDALQASFAVVGSSLSWAGFILPAFFLGIVSSFLPLWVAARLVAGRRFAEYAHYEYERVGAARRLGISAFFLLVMAVIMVVVNLCLNSYSRIDTQTIAVNWYGMGENTYSYESIDKIIVTSNWRTPKDEIRSDKRLHIIFSDGEDWWCDCNNIRFGPSCRDGDELLEILSAKSGKPVTKALFIEDVTGHRTR